MLLWLFLKRSFFIFDKATSFISTITNLFFSCPFLLPYPSLFFGYTHICTHTDARVLPPLLLLLPLFILNGVHNPILTCYAVFRVRSLESGNCWTRSEVSCASVGLRENTLSNLNLEKLPPSQYETNMRERKSNTALVKVSYIIHTTHAPNHLKPKFVTFCSHCSPPDSDISSGLILPLLQCQWKNVS